MQDVDVKESLVDEKKSNWTAKQRENKQEGEEPSERC